MSGDERRRRHDDRARRVGVARGVVQGVGFRPTVARVARALGLGGGVHNTRDGVRVEIEGPRDALDAFDARLRAALPEVARLQSLDWRDAEPVGTEAFVVRPSEQAVGADGDPSQDACAAASGAEELALSPDVAVCAACLAEVGDPADRRHGDAFASCAACGPRYAICEALPWDRARTAMRHFARCAACEREYLDPEDRRFHAQTSCCPRCGPALRACAAPDAEGRCAPVAEGSAALDAAAACLRRGGIVAVLGVGGFQLWADARDERAVAELRRRKRREREPFAVMVTDLEGARALARPTDAEERALRHPAAPIVLVERIAEPAAEVARLAPSVAPGRRRLGVMLPCAPLLHLLSARLGGPAVVTSANVHGAPIAADARELGRQGPLADLVLTHDRAVVARIDDAVVHVVAGRMRVLRSGRGFAPSSLTIDAPPARLVAYGAHLRCAPALLDGTRATLLPHVGDLDSPAARDALAACVDHAQRLLGHRAEAGVVDAHPDLGGTRVGASRHARLLRVGHHHAHVAAALAEHGEGAALGLAWDGTGLGDDGSAWGGEALAVDAGGARRVGHLRPFPLPGGDASARDGMRALAGLLAAGDLPPPPWFEQDARRELARFAAVAARPALSPPTTSVGRLLDGVAALLGVRRQSTFEGEAAMDLEDLAAPGAAPYPLPIGAGGVVDWRPMLRELLHEPGDPARASSRVHATLVALADTLARAAGARTVALVGGCFANRWLAEGATEALSARGVRTLLPERVPPGDGGLALGQLWVGAHALGGA
jgi:hydrogenase maturation protein HypF